MQGKGLFTKFFLLLTLLNSSLAFSGTIGPAEPDRWGFLHGHLLLQAGGFWSNQGKTQHINIVDLVGDQFTVTKRSQGNGLGGVGYFFEGGSYTSWTMSYGINAFYLAKTSVSGNVIQENLFTNLAYGYHLTHFPVYAVAKSTIPLSFTEHALTVDVGIGPNFMRATGFRESSLDGGITIPDTIFSGHTSTTFSATAGVGVKISPTPLECGYRFFYLGKGRFSINNSQVLDSLKTGTAYANAIVCSLSIG